MGQEPTSESGWSTGFAIGAGEARQGVVGSTGGPSEALSSAEVSHMRRFLFAGALFLALALLTGCGGEKGSAPTEPEMAKPEILGAVYVNNYSVNSHCVSLYADQTIETGQVCVTVEDDQLCVTYTVIGGWEFREVHLWIGETLAEMPQTRKGNPKVGNFPYTSGDITGQTTYTFCIPVADVNVRLKVATDVHFKGSHFPVESACEPPPVWF